MDKVQPAATNKAINTMETKRFPGTIAVMGGGSWSHSALAKLLLQR